MNAAPGTVAVPPLALALRRALQADGVAFWRTGEDGPMRLMWASGFSVPAGLAPDDWKKALQASVARCASGTDLLRVKPKTSEANVELVFVPVTDGGVLLGVGGFCGGEAMVAACTSHREIVLESLPVLARAIRSPGSNGEADLSALALGLVSSREKSDAARVAADALQSMLGLKRVSLFEKTRGKWRIIASSGARTLDARSAATMDIVTEFEKTLGLENPSACFSRILSHWHNDSSARHVGLLAEGSWTTRQDSVMRAAAPLVAHALHARRTLVQKFWPEAEDESPASRKKAFIAKSVTTTVAAALALLLLWPFPRTYTGACELVPSQRGAAVAEIGGRIDEILVAEGDTVEVGQPVARVDSGELRAQFEAARQTEAKAGAEAREQQQRDEIGAFRQAQLEQRRASEEARKLALDLEQCTVRAPVGGVVLTKDLALKRGEVAQPGTVVCEIAALSGWDLRIKLDELDAGPLELALVRAGSLRVRYVLQARSDVALEGTINSRKQISQMVYPEEKGTFIYVTLSRIELPEALRSEVRPGFSGIAKIQGPRSPLIFSALGRLWQRVRLYFFL